MLPVPTARIRPLNAQPIRPGGGFVLYWMTSARRCRSSFGLQRAVEIAADLHRPLVVLEALRCDYPWASDRLHRFVLDGMAAQARALARRRILYHPYVEPAPGRGRGLLRALGERACAIVTDWHPASFLPHMAASAARQVSVRLEAVDANGLIPLAVHPRVFPTARGYRAFVQRSLREHLQPFPEDDPLRAIGRGPALDALPSRITSRWPAADAALLDGAPDALARLPIDHTVAPAAMRGGSMAARRALQSFIARRLGAYATDRNHPDADGTSHLSPYLHFGHLSAHEIFSAVMTHEGWTTRRLARLRSANHAAASAGHARPRGTDHIAASAGHARPRGADHIAASAGHARPRGAGHIAASAGHARGARDGWWGVSPSADAFLDQLVVWRELAFNAAEWMPDYDAYETLPAWARQTLERHRVDRRSPAYDLATLDAAETRDDVWNAAQRQLRTDGWFHGYMRMLWGKKILEWSAEPAGALGVMEHLMNRYALDGRDPVSYAGFAWVLGRYDRPWPERPIFGTVRCMTSASARRKLRMKAYLEKYRRSPADERPSPAG